MKKISRVMSNAIISLLLSIMGGHAYATCSDGTGYTKCSTGYCCYYGKPADGGTSNCCQWGEAAMTCSQFCAGF